VGGVIAALLGLSSALVYGIGDFVGGVASRRMPAQRVVLVSASTGSALLLVIQLAAGPAWSPAALGWGAASGIANAGGILLLYIALAIGPMSVLSPITAVLAALVPVVVGLTTGERLSGWQLAGLPLAVAAVVLAGADRSASAHRASARGIAIAVVSGVLIGLTLVGLDAAPADSGVQPLLANRAVSAVLLAVVVAVTLSRRAAVGGAAGSTRRAVPLAVLCGLIDLAANGLLLAALRAGDLSVTGALVALYPVPTVVLAALVLRERLAPLQLVGAVAAVAAAALLALG
jgi:drug/metabolite transporter (DMT)-like permease